MGRFFYNPFTKEMINKKILFIHIPKAGGTSIATALYGKASGHPFLYQYYLANKHFTKTFYKFCVVRNPYDRLVSAFSHISNGNSNPELKLLFKELNIKSFDDLIFNLNDKIIYKKFVKKQPILDLNMNLSITEMFVWTKYLSLKILIQSSNH